MKALLITPAVLVIVLGLAIELEGIARSSSEKALDFADDMNSAMDCARLGRPIRECSPGLYAIDFDEEIQRTLEIMDEFENIPNATYLNVTELMDDVNLDNLSIL